jgi:dipicolinate synthase subunit B
MSLKGKKIGIALTGSFCTFEKVFVEMTNLMKKGVIIQTIFSFNTQNINSRFGKAKNFIQKAERITKNKPILTIEGSEPLGPKNFLDILVILPCTGNSLAKLANAITDTPVLMAAKAHLRNQKPLLIAISTNDALGMSMKNIGLLLNAKNIYFIPFGQDDYKTKPNSMTSDVKLLIPSIEKAIKGKQIQPIII